jgi:hypothetical protein
LPVAISNTVEASLRISQRIKMMPTAMSVPDYGAQAPYSTAHIVRNKLEPNKRYWAAHEDQALTQAVAKHNAKNWKLIADEVKGRDHSQCIQRWRKTLDPTLIKGIWTEAEDQLLLKLVTLSPTSPWPDIAAQIPGRFTRQCRDRWNTALNPGLDKTPFIKEEDHTLMVLVSTMGTAWSNVATMLPGRTQTRVRDRWRSIKRRRDKEANRAAKGLKAAAVSSSDASYLLNLRAKNHGEVGLRVAPQTPYSSVSMAPPAPPAPPAPSVPPFTFQPKLANLMTTTPNQFLATGSSSTSLQMGQLIQTRADTLPPLKQLGIWEILPVLPSMGDHFLQHSLALLKTAGITPTSPVQRIGTPENSPPISNTQGVPDLHMLEDSLKRISAADLATQPNPKRLRTFGLTASPSYMVGKHQLCS